MSKEKIIAELGEPSAIRGAVQKESVPLEIFEYFVNDQMNIGSKFEHYSLYFSDNKLIRWGQSLDLEQQLTKHLQEPKKYTAIEDKISNIESKIDTLESTIKSLKNELNSL